jgi:hypothetical protein
VAAAAGPEARAAESSSAGVEANARLTGLAGLVILVLIVAQAITVVVQPRSVLTLHNTIGLLLVPLTALKLGSTGWRMAHYYRGMEAYRRKGPPPLALRLLGPLLAVLTVLLLGSGTLLIFGPPATHSGALALHKASFYLWLAAVVVHAGCHLAKAARLVLADLSGRSGKLLPGRRLRVTALMSCLMVGGIVATLFAGRAASYLHLYPLR